jgi:hypothetical protein
MDIWNGVNSEYKLDLFHMGGRNNGNESKAFWGKIEKKIAEKADNMSDDNSMKKNNDNSMNTTDKNDFNLVKSK